MKTTLNSLLIAAAGLTLSAAAAYGQSRMTANVPFAFTTAAGTQPAGQYTVANSADGSMMKLENRDTRNSSLLGPGVPNGVEKKANPRLVFVCGSESGCALTSVVIGDGRAWSYKAPRMKPSETARITVVNLESRLAE